MKDLDIQLKKAIKKLTDSRLIISVEYHDFLDVFFKEKADELLSHRKYDHRIELKEGNKSRHEYASLYNMSEEELVLMKQYLQEHLNKGFIQSSTASYASSVLFVKKSDEELRFCVNYRKLNAIIKKNRYSISLIAETIARLSKAQWITKIDIKHAFNRIRIHLEDENLTTFRIKYESYKYIVTSFKFTNELITFQNFIYDTLMNYLNDFVMIYLDDILIYSKTKKEHVQHVRKVLQRLREAGIQSDVDKCDFHTTETKFLDLIVGRNDIRINSEKMKTIVDWNKSQNLKHVQVFFEFVNFYRRFIKNFSKLAKSLIQLTKKNHLFSWSIACEKAFQEFKKRVTEALVLSYFSSKLKTFVESDFSDYVSIDVLSQRRKNDIIRSVVYFSKTLSSTECNYEIYDKELLIIIRCFEQWRLELQSINASTTILWNHKSLEYFMTTKKLNRRQTRWAEFLAKFDFRIAYQSERQNEKANSLTRRSKDRSLSDQNDRQKHMHQILLSSEKVDRINHLKENRELCLFNKIKTFNQKDSRCKEIRQALIMRKKNFDEMLLKHFKIMKDNVLLFRNKLWVLDLNELKLQILKKIHDQSVVEHLEFRRTLFIISRHFYWTGMRDTTERYIRNCHTCKRSKAVRDRYSGLLKSLSISKISWRNIIMNFVTELSQSDEKNAILVIVNRMIKMRHFIACYAEDEETSVEETAKLLINHVWKLHDLSESIVSDRDPQFVSMMWDSLCRSLKIKAKLFIAFHSKTNDQSEIANKKMKRYLRIYCNYQQDDWIAWLSMTEYAFNAAVSASSELFSFMTNYDFESRMSVDSIEIDDTVRERIAKRKAAAIIENMKKTWLFARQMLVKSQEHQKHQADRKRIFSSNYQIDDLVWLSTKNLQTSRSSRKLDHKWIGPYAVKRVLSGSCTLNLSSFMKIHSTFHTSLLTSMTNDLLCDQIIPPSSSVMIEDNEEFELDDILDSRISRGKLQYKVIWTEHSSDSTWYPASNFTNAQETIEEFHRKYSTKSRLDSIIVNEIAHLQGLLASEIQEAQYWGRVVKALITKVLDEMNEGIQHDEIKDETTWVKEWIKKHPFQTPN